MVSYIADIWLDSVKSPRLEPAVIFGFSFFALGSRGNLTVVSLELLSSGHHFGQPAFILEAAGQRGKRRLEPTVDLIRILASCCTVAAWLNLGLLIAVCHFKAATILVAGAEQLECHRPFTAEKLGAKRCWRRRRLWWPFWSSLEPIRRDLQSNQLTVGLGLQPSGRRYYWLHRRLPPEHCAPF